MASDPGKKKTSSRWQQLGLFGEEVELDKPKKISTPRVKKQSKKKAPEDLETRTARLAELPEGTELFEIAVEGSVRTTFTYTASKSLTKELALGARVLVPFGPRKIAGYVVGRQSYDAFLKTGYDPKRLKPISKRVDVFSKASSEAHLKPLITNELLLLARWIARQYACSLGTALAAMLPSGVKKGASAARVRLVQLAQPVEAIINVIPKLKRKAPKQAVLLEALIHETEPVAVPGLLSKTGVSSAALKTLEAKDYIVIRDQIGPTIGDTFGDGEDSEGQVRLTLMPAQDQATNTIVSALKTREQKTFLLQGVTGSGKTEVYLRALETALDMGKQAIVLVPEIALTPQTAYRFESRFGRQRVAILHSHLTGGERAEAWRNIRAGNIDIAIGARSALFAPFENLGCIIIDEEHEGAYKQDCAPRYHARSVALERARLNKAVLILGSATPSLESCYAARKKEFEFLLLPERVAGQAMPKVQVIDMRVENQETKKYNYLSRGLNSLLRAVLAKREQAILFLNRRGFATVVKCVRCGHTEKCEQCDITLTNHRSKDALICHYCGYTKPVPSVCAKCSGPGMKFWGLGTERVETEVRKAFPEARIARMDSDTMSKREAYLNTLTAFKKGEIDCLIGTQMIAKGLDFPNVTLVGIVLADTALHMPDFRSRERTFQLLEQVAGRAGRSDKGGRVIVQTYLPDDPAILAAAKHDISGFTQEELLVRRSFGYPPFGHLARILIRGKDKIKVIDASTEAAEAIRKESEGKGIKLLGPSPATIEMLEGWHRYHIMLKANSQDSLAELFEGPTWAVLKKLKGVEASVDIDPMAMM